MARPHGNQKNNMLKKVTATKQNTAYKRFGGKRNISQRRLRKIAGMSGKPIDVARREGEISFPYCPFN